jgi:GTP cyclohydrolase IA
MAITCKSCKIHMKPDPVAAAAAIHQFLEALGLDPNANVDLRETGTRVAAAYIDELCAGYSQDPQAVLREHVFAGASTGPIALRAIPITTTCPHHLLTATGTANFVFQPREHLIGLGAVPEIFNILAARLVLQEQLTEQFATLITEHLRPEWCIVHTKLSHGCMHARGAKSRGAVVDAIATRGAAPAAIIAAFLAPNS